MRKNKSNFLSLLKIDKSFHFTVPVEPIIVGKIGSPYGIGGWVRLFSFTEKIENIFNYQPWFIKREFKWQKIWLESWKYHNQSMIVKIMNIEDRKAITLLTNEEIVIDASQLPDLKIGEYYWKDLLGCQVTTVNGYQLGKVIDLMKTGSNDVLVVKANMNDIFGIKKRLVPFLDRKVIKNLDFKVHAIEVEWYPDF